MTVDGKVWLSDAQQAVWRSWLAVQTLLPARLDRELQSEADLSIQDFVVLVRLTEHADGRVRVTDLARDLTWEKSRTSHHLTRMERRGLVARQQCPDDRRGAFLAVTDAGRTAIEGAAPGHARVVRSMIFDHLTDDELAVLAGVFDGVRDRLSE